MRIEKCRLNLISPLHFGLLALLLMLALPALAWAQSDDPVETIHVDSDLVDLKVSVLSGAQKDPAIHLAPNNFLILEDGVPQTISFFATADEPFDLVLLLDLSGSTADKMKLIRRSAKRFVEATRPVDRSGVVTFTDKLLLACPLTHDRKLLKKAIDHIEKPTGGTNFWDALRYVLETMLPAEEASTRSAVVVMTDGVDNALPDVFGDGSKTTFAQLLDTVGSSDAIVFPVYLDTEKEEIKRHRTPAGAYPMARAELAQIAAASGTAMYKAAKLEDLDEVYPKVIAELSTVYSIGYRPSNSLRDGKWRSIKVDIQNSPKGSGRTKRGYFAKSLGAP